MPTYQHPTRTSTVIMGAYEMAARMLPPEPVEQRGNAADEASRDMARGLVLFVFDSGLVWC